MAVKIRLKRLGKIRAPYYRIVVADSRTKRDGRVIEEIGKYHPTEEPSFIEVKSDRALYWLGVGAQPSPQVEAILKLTGDWGTFKGDKNATTRFGPGTTMSAEAIEAFITAARAAVGDNAAEAEIGFGEFSFATGADLEGFMEEYSEFKIDPSEVQQ